MKKVTSPVQWESTIKTLIDNGLKKSYELGPGKVNKNGHLSCFCILFLVFLTIYISKLGNCWDSEEGE